MLPPGYGSNYGMRFRTTAGGARLQKGPGGNWYRAGWAPGYGPHAWGAPMVGGPQNSDLVGGGGGAWSPSAAQRAAALGASGLTPESFPRWAGSIRTPGYTPDYNYLIQNDPAYLAAHSLGQEALSSAGASRDAALKALEYDYSGNPHAQMQEILRSYEQDRASGLNQLAGRGALHSGETPYLEDNLSHRRGAQEYAAGKTYAEQVARALQAYLGTQRQVAGQEAQALSEASSRLQDNPLYQPTQGFAKLVDAQKGLYQDMEGKFWILDASGNPQRVWY